MCMARLSGAPRHAAGKSEEEIRRELGADGLLYQSIEDLIAVGTSLNPAIREFDTSCFTGAYLPPCACMLRMAAQPSRSASIWAPASVLSCRRCMRLRKRGPLCRVRSCCMAHRHVRDQGRGAGVLGLAGGVLAHEGPAAARAPGQPHRRKRAAAARRRRRGRLNRPVTVARLMGQRCAWAPCLLGTADAAAEVRAARGLMARALRGLMAELLHVVPHSDA